MAAPVDLSETGMANGALALIGEPPISSLDDTKRRAARECKRHFASVRDGLLAKRDWEFARNSCTPSALSTPPSATYQYRYMLPADCIRVTKLNDADMDPWESMSSGDDVTVARAVDTNCVAPVVWYTRQLVNPAQWAVGFQTLFHAALAAKVNPSVGRDKALTAQLMGYVDRELSDAAVRDSQQRTGETISRTPSWVQARWGISQWAT